MNFIYIIGFNVVIDLPAYFSAVLGTFMCTEFLERVYLRYLENIVVIRYIKLFRKIIGS